MSANEQPLTVEFKINFLAPAQGDALEARAKVVKSGRRLKHVAVEVFAGRAARGPRLRQGLGLARRSSIISVMSVAVGQSGARPSKTRSLSRRRKGALGKGSEAAPGLGIHGATGRTIN